MLSWKTQKAIYRSAHGKKVKHLKDAQVYSPEYLERMRAVDAQLKAEDKAIKTASQYPPFEAKPVSQLTLL